MPSAETVATLASRVSVVIPAFNEQDGIEGVVGGVRSQAAWREVLVIDDGSSDATATRAEAAGARVLRHPYNKGNGAAVKTGIRAAAGEIILLMDADGQHDPEEIAAVLAPMETHDMAIGARSSHDQDWLRALGNAGFKRFASWLTGRPIPDLTSGFRAARRERLLEIIHLLPNGFSYPTTSCLAFLKAGHSVTFIPVKARRRIGKSKIRVLRDGVRFLLLIVKVVTLYSPLKVFFPVSALALLLGLAYGAWNVIVHHKIPMGAALLVQLSVIVFFFGLISEQIASQQERK
jgi:glycosyltransferase involved in cell wall biosynthesis